MAAGAAELPFSVVEALSVVARLAGGAAGGEVAEGPVIVSVWAGKCLLLGGGVQSWKARRDELGRDFPLPESSAGHWPMGARAGASCNCLQVLPGQPPFFCSW